MKPFTDTITGVLERSPNAITYLFSREVASYFEGFVVHETDDSSFDPVGFADEGHCGLFVDHTTHAEISLHWEDDEIQERPVTAVFEALWQSHRLRLVRLRVETECTQRWVIVSPSVTIGQAFFEAVCRWSNDARGDILVFRNGYWTRDKRLVDQISSSSLGDLVAPPGFVDQLRQETVGFFECEELYKKHGIAWKRGVLMLGPPGNGKTHAIKGLVRESGKPCLYVRHLESEKSTLHRSIERVFARARAMSPCLLIFEDLDSMVTPRTRSAFLNELDGFASNDGVLVVATANYPEKLDPAILDRPSRFDRKVTFALPGPDERFAYLLREAGKWDAKAQPDAKALKAVAKASEGYSYAYLKELCLSALVEWVRTGASVSACLKQQADVLREQMRTDPVPTPDVSQDDDD